MRLQGKVAVITAAGSGIGRASALAFAAEGSRVMVADIDAAGGQETVALVKTAGGEASFIQTDVTRTDDLSRMIKVTVETYGRLDILYNHAGMPGPIGDEDFDENRL